MALSPTLEFVKVNLQILQGAMAQEQRLCPSCQQPLVKSGSSVIALNHLPIGNSYTQLQIVRPRLRCLNSGCVFNTYTIKIPFKDERHRITKQLRDYVKDLLVWGLTLKSTAFITGLDKMVVKAIHKEILEEKYTYEGKLVAKAGKIFNRPELKGQGENEDKYEKLLAENKLFLTADIIKEHLDQAYRSQDQVQMCAQIQDIIEICRETENKRFIWFARLLGRHLTGIYTFAKHHISTGRLEGLNNKIKTERRQGYGYPDDEYFFLRLMEASKRKTIY